MNQAANDRLVSLGRVERSALERARYEPNAARIGARSIDDRREDAQAEHDKKTVMTIARFVRPGAELSPNPIPARAARASEVRVKSFAGKRNCRKPGRNVAIHQ